MAVLSGAQTANSSTALNPIQKTEDTQQTPADSKSDKTKIMEERTTHPRVMQALHIEVTSSFYLLMYRFFGQNFVFTN